MSAPVPQPSAGPMDLAQAQRELESLRGELEKVRHERDTYWKHLARLLPPPPADYPYDETEWFARLETFEPYEKVIDDVFGKEESELGPTA